MGPAPPVPIELFPLDLLSESSISEENGPLWYNVNCFSKGRRNIVEPICSILSIILLAALGFCNDGKDNVASQKPGRPQLLGPIFWR